MTTEVHVVVPGDLDSPTGGNVYDRRACLGLTELGLTVSVHRVRGTWPSPDGTAAAGLDAVLRGLPEGAVVLGDGLVLCGVPDVVVPHASQLRLVVLVHLPLGDESGLDTVRATRLRQAERRTLAACRAVVVTGPWAVGAVRALGVAPERVHVVEPGTDPAPPSPGTPSGSSLLAVAALVPRKGQHLLVEALAGLVRLRWTCRLVGPVDRAPDYADEVRSTIERHGLAERVEIVGPLEGDQLERAWARSDLLVLPSLAETYGMVVAEALVRGLPVLTTRGGGAERTARDAGLLVPPGDVQALRGALHRWLTDPCLRADLRARAAAAGRHLGGWDATAARLAEVLRRVTE